MQRLCLVECEYHITIKNNLLATDFTKTFLTFGTSHCTPYHNQPPRETEKKIIDLKIKTPPKHYEFYFQKMWHHQIGMWGLYVNVIECEEYVTSYVYLGFGESMRHSTDESGTTFLCLQEMADWAHKWDCANLKCVSFLCAIHFSLHFFKMRKIKKTGNFMRCMQKMFWHDLFQYIFPHPLMLGTVPETNQCQYTKSGTPEYALMSHENNDTMTYMLYM